MNRFDGPRPFIVSSCGHLTNRYAPKSLINKKLLVAPGITTRKKKLQVTKGIAASNKDDVHLAYDVSAQLASSSGMPHSQDQNSQSLDLTRGPKRGFCGFLR